MGVGPEGCQWGTGGVGMGWAGMGYAGVRHAGMGGGMKVSSITGIAGGAGREGGTLVRGAVRASAKRSLYFKALFCNL